jgi:hypothetical protein
MREWILTDYFEALDGDDEPDRMVITSVDQFRQELGRLAALPPRVVELESPDKKVVRIGIGGPLGGLGVITRSAGTIYIRLAKAKTTACEGGAEFLYWQQPCRLAAGHLFPVADLIDLLVGYVANGAFTPDLAWDTR